ncbi:PLDc N-terminal domain-containing protein [Rhodococcus sp. BP-349]|uniref:PLDc N-terminal domain-containing protein n=1 Tax=unclassified Rhodococcus (in: high G+C Gram-positive bacteria) TaxID=192944 RepID=UPI001C9BA124|nr:MULTISPECIES: PLDc N-terminal domain-containing protein [unclassified Rhodococcus (in: high G+C Gram-positive bacteria)]MBY6540374.1 PLDc N-terminal domain-containing protein [Rhodococcus sp. BP-363]MBY6545601.1 PLDc N-terminal domain-containing protein [Rhodococcus sp. BP-369]MBY6564831.1 PLDc N-terminal domain-containing protein [Rhodococcus sp. BP-370]MBY6578233.1 PLDc N-terminal domain-containing protein [Rhodococcus sp. BP-364]MBY6587534.1 PLDc N-terminal domain-containing protein [Rho
MELVAIVVVTMFLIAAVSIGRATHLGSLARICWAAIAFVLPAIGPLLWFALGQRYGYRMNGEVRR